MSDNQESKSQSTELCPCGITNVGVGMYVRVLARPPYVGLVEWCSDHPGGKVTVRPSPGQGMTERARTVWKDKIMEIVSHG